MKSCRVAGIEANPAIAESLARLPESLTLPSLAELGFKPESLNHSLEIQMVGLGDFGLWICGRI